MEKFIGHNGKEYVANVNGCGYTQEEIEAALATLSQDQQDERKRDAESFAANCLGDSRAYWGRLASCLIRRNALKEKVAFQIID